MPKIAVIQDGTELARQTYADASDCFKDCCDLLSADGTSFTMQVFSDDAVGYLLDGLNPREYSCLVFASNSLLSGQIGRALNRRQDDLQRYLRQGGGMVVLHQLRDSLQPVLPVELCPNLVDRRLARGEARATTEDPNDVILRYPSTIPIDRLNDQPRPNGPPSLYYKSLNLLTLPKKLKPILQSEREALLVRTYDHTPERVVISTIPLDWRRELRLLSNAIRFASVGMPRRLVWRDTELTRAQLLLYWLNTDGSAAIRNVPDRSAKLDMVDAWLLSSVRLCVVSPRYFDIVKDREEVKRYLDRGGALTTVDQDSVFGTSRVQGLVGRFVERNLAARLSAELHACSGWDTVQYAFELRNIVSALSVIWDDPDNRTDTAIEPASLDALKAKVRDRLYDDLHREDLSSSIALVQTLAFLEGPIKKVESPALCWMHGHPSSAKFDVKIQIRGAIALGQRSLDHGLLADANIELASASPTLGSLAPVVRILDTIEVLHRVELIEDDGASTHELATQVCSLLDRFSIEPGVGWMSVEATADLTRGLVALHCMLPSTDSKLSNRVSEHVASGAAVLRRASRRYERNPKGVAWLARITHALILVDRRFPMGLQQLAGLEWPKRSLDGFVGSSAEQSLLNHLVLENRRLRRKERLLRDQRLAAKIGRGTTTILVSGLIVTVAFLATILIVRWDTNPTVNLISNIGILVTVLVTALPAAYRQLDRQHLLAGPTSKLLSWISATSPVVTAYGKLKSADKGS